MSPYFGEKKNDWSILSCFTHEGDFTNVCTHYHVNQTMKAPRVFHYTINKIHETSLEL